MTDGFDVFVHDVIAAIVTAPWSSVNFSPSAEATGVGLERRGGRVAVVVVRRAALYSSSGELPGGSDAGNDSEPSRSTRSWSTSA